MSKSFLHDLQGKTAIITGASRGIGAAIAVELSTHGVNIVTNSTEKSRFGAQRVLKQIKVNGSSGYWLPGDIVKRETAKNLIEFAVYKTGRVDILVNNAGIARSKPFIKMTAIDWNAVINTNLNASYYTTHAFIKEVMKEKHGASIIFISSIGTQGNPWQANYAASKGGLESFMRSIGAEHAGIGIRANAISPGPVENDKTKNMKSDRRNQLLSQSPLGRFIENEEVANVATFLASERSSAINASVVYADGGILRK